MRAIIILAGGDSNRVKPLLGELPNKVLIPIGNVPNVIRTTLLCSELSGGVPVHVVREEDAKAHKGLSIAHAISRFSDSFDEFVIVLGDVVWDAHELKQLLSLSPGQALRHPTNPFTEKPYEEILGAVLGREHDVSGCTHLRLFARLGFEFVDSEGWSDDIDTEEDFELRLPKLRELAAGDVYAAQE